MHDRESGVECLACLMTIYQRVLCHDSKLGVRRDQGKAVVDPTEWSERGSETDR